MDLDDVFSDKPVVTVDEPEKTEPDQSTDVKADSEKEPDPAAPSAATEAKKEDEAKAEPEDKPSPQRDDKGRFAKTQAPIAALIEERRKRQELEQELQRYRESKPKTDFFEDPDKATTEHVREAMSPLEREVLDLKVQLQRLKNPDFDEVMMLVLEKAQADPLLKHQIDSAPDPMTFIYREGKRMKELADVDGDIAKYREKVLAEHSQKTTELETRLKALEAENRQLKESLNKREKVPQSLNAEPSSPAKDDAFAGPTPLSQVFN